MGYKMIFLGCVALVALNACTAGSVSIDGEPVNGGTIELTTCYGSHVTEISEHGNWYFNPFDPDEYLFHQSDFVRTGPLLIRFSTPTLSSDAYKFIDNHQYDQTCKIDFDGERQDLPCKLYELQFATCTYSRVDPSLNVLCGTKGATIAQEEFAAACAAL